MEAKKKTPKKNDKGWDSVCGGMKPKLVPMLDKNGKPITDKKKKNGK